MSYYSEYLNIEQEEGSEETKKSEIVFLLGGPGSGKGFFGEKIAKTYNYEPISAGELLRKEKENPNSKYGKLIKEYQIEGKILPAEITIGLIKSKIFELNSKGIYNILLDGFPRNYENLESWNKIIGDSIKLKFVIYLKCPENIMIERILKRGETSGRADDNKETIVKRIKVFNEQSLPVIKYYKKLKLVKEIDSSKKPEQVFDSIKKIFKEDTGMDSPNKYIIGVAGASGYDKTYFSNYLKGITIIYIIVNFILLVIFRNSKYLIKRFLIFHIIILVILFINGVVLFFKNKKDIINRSKNIQDTSAKQGFILSAFTRSSGHLFFCYIGFLYIFVTLYFSYLLYMGRIHPSNRFAIITLVFIGLIIAIKETYAHFSQCINSVDNKTTIPFCDNHYYKYWNCIHNEYYTSAEEE